MKEILLLGAVTFWVLVIILSGAVGQAVYNGSMNVNPNHTQNALTLSDFVWNLLTFQIIEMGALSTFLWIVNAMVIISLIMIIRGN